MQTKMWCLDQRVLHSIYRADSSTQLSAIPSSHSGRTKWNDPSSAFSGVLLSGVFPSAASLTKLYSPLILATTLVLSSIGRTLRGAVDVYSKLSPGLSTGCRPVTPGPCTTSLLAEPTVWISNRRDTSWMLCPDADSFVMRTL